MGRSLIVDEQHLETVRRALHYGQFSSQRSLATNLGLSLSTISRFFTGKSVDRPIFVQLCDALNLDWQVIARAETGEDASPNSLTPASDSSRSLLSRTQGLPYSPTPRIWDGAMMDVSGFCGRTTELTTLKHWLTVDGCRLVMLLGMGGIGKTSLSIKLAQTIQASFDVLIWRSLRNAPPVIEILVELVRILSHQSDITPFKTVDEGITHLIPHLRSSRCLLLIDNIEAILQGRIRGSTEVEQRVSGRYLAGYEGYGQLFQAIGEIAHHSCLIVTSREPPQELITRAGATLPIRCLQLAGLSTSAAQDLLSTRGTFTGSDTDWQRLIDHYAGNPLALKIVASFIGDFFEGDLAQFLKCLGRSPLIFDDIRDLLNQQCNA